MRSLQRWRGDDRHARYLELLSLRLDEPLSLDLEWQLTVHLDGCRRCRAAQKDYREHRQTLRALPDVHVPRDLGGRVSAALDREVLRGPRRPSGERLSLPARPRVGRPTVAATSAAVSLTALTLGALVLLDGMPLAVAEATPLRPTPMSVPGQALAYLGAGPDGLALYRTSVDRVCPLTAIDCVAPADDQAVLAFSGGMRPDSLALSPAGDRLVLQAEDTSSKEDVFAVVNMPPQVARQTSLDGPAPAPSADAGPVLNHPPATSSPRATPATTVVASSLPPDTSPPLRPGGATTSRPPEAEAPTLTPAPSLASPGPVSTAAALTMVAILEDVRGAGAPPAWSADGSILAFSAMPADGSRGPDVYVWQPGDESARPVTTDHASYFASWSGTRIVASQLSVSDASVVNVLIDPQSGARTALDAPPLWLPHVNVTRTSAVAWQGRLEIADGVARPGEGQLYAFDWSHVDPFAGEAAPDSVAPTPTNDAPAETPSTSPAADRAAPTGAAKPVLTLPPGRILTEGTRSSPSASPAAETAAPDEPADSPSPTTSLEPRPSRDIALMPLEPGRDPVLAPVLDWEVRWAPDGTALGYWIADVPGASWGSLTVLAVGHGGHVRHDAPLLAASLARRSFTLGLNRVAWVAPADQATEGELRVSVWGPGGSGVLRISDPDLEGVLAAF